MPKKIEVGPDRRYVRTIVPWALALGVFLLYLFTLNHWISFGSLTQVAKVAGYSWQPDLYGPLTWLVTLPFRLLPATTIPVALNLFSAACAALTLALLARSVALWPHDRTHNQRQKELGPFSLLSIPLSWLPPVVAVLACGLQLTFWEYATSANTIAAPFGAGIEMLDLLLFAYVIRCLLEFRLDQRESWLFRAGFLFGVAMTSNWAMIALFPLFLASLVWLQGLAFFNVRFLLRLFVALLIGLSFYLLLPIVNMGGHVPVPFWSALKLNLGGERQALGSIFHFLLGTPEGKQQALLFALTSFIPILLISIKWASYFGDTSSLGVALSTFVMHVVHGLFLVACLWVMLDPPFSPRSQNFGLPFLTLTYLAALSIGYFTGYFLLLFRPKPAGERRAPGEGLLHLINLSVTVLVWLLAIVVPATLVYKNYSQIRISNGPTLKKFARLLASNLPRNNDIVMSDDVRRLFLVQALEGSPTTTNTIFLDTTSLPAPEYHHFLRKRYPLQWPLEPDQNTRSLIDPLTIRGVLMTVAQTNTLYYLHPSFGYYFEAFCLEPHGLIYKLFRYPTNTIVAPLPSKDLIAENATHWSVIGQELFPTIREATETRPYSLRPGLFAKILKAAKVKPEPNRDMKLLGALLSRSLDYWGVQLQKSGDLAEAAVFFERTLELNPENVVARVNLECNKNLRAGRKPAVLFKPVEEEFGKFRTWDQIMNEDGPFDEPTYSFKQGLVLVGQSLYRQAATEFGRVHELSPEHLYASLWLSQLYVLGKMPDLALKVIDDLHQQATHLPRTNALELLYVEMSAHLAKDDITGAAQTAAKMLEKYPSDEEVIGAAAQIFMNFHAYTNALPLLDRQLALSPDDVNAQRNRGVASLQTGAYENAIAAFSKVLTVETNTASELHNQALFGRAVAYLKSGKLDDAEQDYQTLQRNFPTSYQIYFGLGEIAYQRKNTNVAIRNYQLYLTNSPINADEIKTVQHRLKDLQPQ